MEKLTKIIATIGPASESEEMIEKLILAGVNIFRFNFKHNTVEWHSERIERVKQVVQKMGVPVGTLIDLQGPELRITMPCESIEIVPGEILAFGQEVFEQGFLESKKKGISITHPEVISHLPEGQQVLAEDGTFLFTVVRQDDKNRLLVVRGGTLREKKNLNIPGSDFPFPVLIERDFEGLRLAAEHSIDFVALSFVRSKTDIQAIREEMNKMNVQGKLIAKIEAKKAIENLDDIINHADGIMVARGDLGVEIPIEQVPYYQKLIIRKCIEHSIPVITATQMLQSMVNEPFPTRAEVSDVANATYDYTDAVMLSGETASGKYPKEAVEAMARTAEFNEKKITTDIRDLYTFSLKDDEAMIVDAAYNLYLELVAKHSTFGGFLVFTHTGRTARLLSRYRPNVPIYAFTSSNQVCNSLTIHYAVTPVSNSVIPEGEVKSKQVVDAVRYLQQTNAVKSGSILIVLHGDEWSVSGGTSTIKIVTAV